MKSIPEERAKVKSKQFTFIPNCQSIFRKSVLLYRLIPGNPPIRLGILILLIICLIQGRAFCGVATEYSSSDVPKEILNNDTISSSLNITDSSIIKDINVKVSIQHYYIPDVEVYLISPKGTRVLLFKDIGNHIGNTLDMVFDDQANESVTMSRAPYTGSFKPMGKLSDFNDEDINGIWKLEVTDIFPADAGILFSWSLIIESVNPLPAPVAEIGPQVTDGVCVSWSMPNDDLEFSSNSSTGIPDNSTVNSTIDVNDFGMIEDVNVKLNIDHGYNEELDVYLIAPDGTRVELFTAVGGSSDNFHNTILDGQASQSIADGTGPFTGSYRPEGSLDNLLGREIHGIWTLEITDNGSNSTGTLQGWSLVPELANVLYLAQCSADSGFDNILTDSGWIIDKSCVFSGLDPNLPYWFRVQARPMNNFLQTTQDDFNTNTLINTSAVPYGDVVLNYSQGELQENFIINNPSFEQSPPLIGWSASFYYRITMGRYHKDGAWASDGLWSMFSRYESTQLYYPGDSSECYQYLDLTGIDVIKFDYASYGYADCLRLAVEIGGSRKWSVTGETALGNIIPAYYNISIDVSNITGVKKVSFITESEVYAWFDAFVFWDNIRAYSTGEPGYLTQGKMISTPITINADDTWDIMTFNSAIPPSTTLTVDLLPGEGTDPIPGYTDLSSGTVLSGLNDRTVRLQVNLVTYDTAVTPVLHDWALSSAYAAGESPWSNIVSCNNGQE